MQKRQTNRQTEKMHLFLFAYFYSSRIIFINFDFRGLRKSHVPTHRPIGVGIHCDGWLRGTVVERRSLTGELSLSCARPAADG